ncbi:hypothetical protein EVAR_88373_1 [Eumeta japonica]|uniref:Uncharacterized protein n=1 Tax=Eumeta variegata TaxID=151549 RepID=A0A4C1XA44_EUMVA|nr:hypothetical protein EVAR_88373_1 [Eumeta japonica]
MSFNSSVSPVKNPIRNRQKTSLVVRSSRDLGRFLTRWRSKVYLTACGRATGTARVILSRTRPPRFTCFVNSFTLRMPGQFGKARAPTKGGNRLRNNYNARSGGCADLIADAARHARAGSPRPSSPACAGASHRIGDVIPRCIYSTISIFTMLRMDLLREYTITTIRSDDATSPLDCIYFSVEGL